MDKVDSSRKCTITGLSVYFADPYAAWQRGANESTNGILRFYFEVVASYYLSCNGPGGTTNRSANSTVASKPVAAPEGGKDITPTANTTYLLNCSGPGGATSSTANVTVVAPSPVVLCPEKEETVNLLIEFDFDKSVVKPEFYANVNAVGEFLQNYPNATITIEGHTDNVGKNAYNQKLSLRRAKAVEKYIVDKFGIDTKRIKAVGYGETKPIDTNKTAEGRYHNRRVQAYHAAVK